MQKKEPKKAVRSRPVAKWKLLDSILYIKMRDKYLQETGVLQKLGKRRWRLIIK
jgi:hypothetical protein